MVLIMYSINGANNVILRISAIIVTVESCYYLIKEIDKI